MENEMDYIGPLTSEEFVAAGGGVCPFCGDDMIEGGPVDIEGPVASQEVSCLACEEQWIEYYHLAGYRPLD